MSADYDNDLAKLQIAQAQQNFNPSFAGLQAPNDPSKLATVLSQLKQQQFLQDRSGSNGDPYGWLTAPSRQAFTSVGQSLGNLAVGNNPDGSRTTPQTPPPSGLLADPQTPQGGPSGTAPAAPGGASAPVDPRQVMNNLIRAAPQYEAALTAKGVPANEARAQTLQWLSSQGVNVGDALVGAQTAVEKSNETKASTSKDTAQAAASNDEIGNRAAERAQAAANAALQQKKDTYTTIASENGYITQRNGLGEIKTVKNQDAASSAVASLSPDAMQSMLDYYHTNNKVPPGIARSPAVAAKFWDAEAQYAAKTGNTAGAAYATAAGQKSAADALTTTQKQLSATTSYLQTMDKNIANARAIGNTLDLTDVNKLNQAIQLWDKGVSDPQYAKYNLFFNAVANESAKIQSGSLGNAPVSDSLRHEMAAVIPATIGKGGMNAVFDALSEEGNNRVSSLAAQRDDLIARLTHRTGTVMQSPTTPSAAPSATPPAPQGAAPSAPVLNYNPKTGKFEQ